MPCYNGDENDGRAAASELAMMRNQIDWRDAALCALMTLMSRNGNDERLNTALNGIDWREAGIKKKDLLGWWSDHRAADRRRREFEANERAAKQAEAARKRKRAEVIASLSAEQREALGL